MIPCRLIRTLRILKTQARLLQSCATWVMVPPFLARAIWGMQQRICELTSGLQNLAHGMNFFFDKRKKKEKQKNTVTNRRLFKNYNFKNAFTRIFQDLYNFDTFFAHFDFRCYTLLHCEGMIYFCHVTLDRQVSKFPVLLSAVFS